MGLTFSNKEIKFFYSSIYGICIKTFNGHLIGSENDIYYFLKLKTKFGILNVKISNTNNDIFSFIENKSSLNIYCKFESSIKDKINEFKDLNINLNQLNFHSNKFNFTYGLNNGSIMDIVYNFEETIKKIL